MKVIVEFDLDNEEDKYKYESLQKIDLYRRFYDEIYDECFRPAIKYGAYDDSSVTDEEQDGIQKCWDKVVELMEELED